MADNQNTGPDKEQTRQVIAGVQEIKKEQGDYNNILKESINLLKKIDRSYEDIYARVSSLDKSQISIKQISNELYKAKQKEFTVSKQLANAEKLISTDSSNRIKQYSSSQSKLAELEKRKAEYERSALKAGTEAERAAFLDKSKSVDFILNKETARNLRLKDGLSVQEAQIVALKEADNIAKASATFGKESLDIEKQTSKQLGISGFLAAGLATKLGVGTEAYEAMTKESRRLVEEDIKRKTLQQQLAEAQKSGNQDQINSLNEQLGLMGKEKSSFSKKMSVLKEGFKAGKTAIKDNLSDPVVLAGTLVAGVAGAYKGLQAGLTKVGDAASKAGNFLAGMTEDSSNIVRGLTSNLSSMARNIPLVGGLLGGLIDGFSAILDLVIGVDDKIIKAGRDLNLNTQEARALNREFQNISFNSGNIFTNSKKLLESQVELSNQLGVVNRLTTEQLETNIMLKDIAGLELDTRKEIVEASTITGQSSKDVVKSVLAQVEGLKDATGIQFQNKQILKEASSLGGYLGLQFAKYPANLTKSLVTVKAMGMELKQLDSIADSFLDFESSISKEFEAQLLTGKDINLTKAREAFLNNDLATAASEITRQVGSANDFLKLNRIQAESLASAFGMSRDQMGEMLKRQELLSKLGAKDTDNAQKQLQLGLQRYQNQKALTAAIGEEAYQNLVNASTQEKMASFIDKIKQSIVDFVERSGIIEKIQGFMDYLSKPENIKKIIGGVRDFFADAVEFIGKAAYYILEGLDYVALGQIPDNFIDSIKSGAENMGAQIRSMGGNFEALTVGDNAANSQVKNSASNTTAPADNMSMARPIKETININGNFYVVDTKRENEYRIERAPDYDTKTGK